MQSSKMTLRQIFFSMEGRIDRSTFWLWGVLPILLFRLVITAIGLVFFLIAFYPFSETFDSNSKSQWFLVLSFPFTSYILLDLMTFIPSLGVQIKRCHDRNRSALFILVAYIPLVWFILLFVVRYTLLCLYEIEAPTIFSYLQLPGLIPWLWYVVEIGFLPGTKGKNRFPDTADNGSLLVAIEAVILVMIIATSAVEISQTIGKRWKIDLTQQKTRTLSDGTKAILARLNQPIKAKLYYAETATEEAPDQIRPYNSYYEDVRTLLEEYAAVSKGMLELEVIDPRPFSDEEEQALRYGLRRFPINETENFFFGLVIHTQFGVVKAIPFFSPNRQNFVEYDISYLIDTAVTRQKRKIGVLSSLPVMGEDVSGYMREMMMRQGQQPQPPWAFIEQLRKQYEVDRVPTDVNDINDIDILMVIHPKGLSEQTLFAIDQYVLKGGRTIVCVDPHCFMDRAPQQMGMQMQMQHKSNSDLNKLLKTWGLEMPENTFAGDRNLASVASFRTSQRPERLIGFLELTPEGECFSKKSTITAELNQVRVFFSGVLNEVADSNDANDVGADIERIPLLTTTNRGNTFTVSGPYELSPMFMDGPGLMKKFTEGSKPVFMGYQVTGRFKSSFPNGIEVESDSPDPNDPNETITTTTRVAGLTEAEEDCEVVVFSDVDFISDMMAYQNSFIGKIVSGDNCTLMLNTIENLQGSSDLAKIRSRGNISRPFLVVDEIERQSEAEKAKEIENINTQIAGFQSELQNVISTAKTGDEEIIDRSILEKKQELELKIRQAQRQLRNVKRTMLDRIAQLSTYFLLMNMGAVPTIIMIVAVVLGVRRSVRKRHYITHASDA